MSDAQHSHGLRERKRLALRQRLSETATLMFLEHGFDNVRVVDIAEKCGVSTKTVWNHFPTKGSLFFDRGDLLAEALRSAASGGSDVLEAVVRCIDNEIDQIGRASAIESAESADALLATVQAFAAITAANPSLRAATAQRLDDLTQVAAQTFSVRNGLEAESPENSIAAAAVIALWKTYLSALLRFGSVDREVADIKKAIRAEMQRATAIVSRVIPDQAL